MKLVEPTIELEEEYLDMLQEWKLSKEELIPFPPKFNPSNFKSFVQKLHNCKIEEENNFVPHSTYWLIDKFNKILGVSNLRHRLNPKLLIEGGHIGYGIRPSCRKNGLGTEILNLTLKKANKIGIKRALITCDKANIGSRKVIINNGGSLWKEHIVEGIPTLNYWVNSK